MISSILSSFQNPDKYRFRKISPDNRRENGDIAVKVLESALIVLFVHKTKNFRAFSSTFVRVGNSIGPFQEKHTYR